MSARVLATAALLGASLITLLLVRGKQVPPTSLLASPGSDAPVAWCQSGGGWRAMSVGMAVARNLHKAGVLPALKHVAGNSGGGWFMTQFGV